MLIPSHRHTAADLRLWAEHEHADRVHGSLASLQKKVQRSVDEIRRFVAGGPCYAGVSWGKDSVVVASLCPPEIPLVWIVYGAENPDCRKVRDVFLARQDYREIVAPRGQHLSEAFREAAKDIGPRYISGLRADESGGRKISMRAHGLSTENSCRPLGWWTVADVFGYLAANNLPVHPAYACLGGGRWSREQLRVASLGGSRGAQFGRREWEREYYGDVLNRLSKDGITRRHQHLRRV